MTRHADKADRYLDYIEKEVAMNKASFKHMLVQQCHLGGGTPSFLSAQQMRRLMNILRSGYAFANDCEISIEIDPRRIEDTYLNTLKGLGFNRISIGVQDIDETVQAAINRTQCTEQVHTLVKQANELGFHSVNLDLIYGLPHQTQESFAKTLSATIEMSTQRVSLFSYAHLPARFAAQRKIKDEWLPAPEQKFALMKLAIETLCGAGYVMIGMDHFAKSDDELAIAQMRGTLHRNFQGYTTKADLDILGLGVSSISFIGDWYLQNVKTLNDYYSRLDEHLPATDKGVCISTDDAIRRAVIMALMCNLHVDKREIERDFEIVFDDYFAQELTLLAPFKADDLLTDDQHTIDVKPHARLLIRTIAMTFDAYMGLAKNHQRFSRVI